MTKNDLTARLWAALAAYHTALDDPAVTRARAQAAFTDSLAALADEYADSPARHRRPPPDPSTARAAEAARRRAGTPPPALVRQRREAILAIPYGQKGTPTDA